MITDKIMRRMFKLIISYNRIEDLGCDFSMNISLYTTCTNLIISSAILFIFNYKCFQGKEREPTQLM